MKVLVFTKQKKQEIVNEVVSALQQEKLVILPTDTVYGIMALATVDKAVQDLYQAKQRDPNKPTALLVSSIQIAQKYIGNHIVSKLGARFWPGPLTIIGGAKIKLGPWAKLGIRVPDEPFLLKVLENLGQPVMASSANAAGEESPTEISQVSAKLLKSVSLAIDKGPTKLSKASTVIEIEHHGFKMLRYGPITKSQIDQALDNKFEIRNSKFEILFICYGNTCRSPMAEALFNKMAKEAGMAARAGSAGVMAISGGTAAPNSIAVMADRGIDLKSHRTRLVDNEILREPDLILAMDNSQLQAIPESYKEKTFLLSDYASDAEEDIFDPIGGDLETYEACANLIEKHIINLINKLRN